MFHPKPRVRIWLYTKPADMRKSYNGLSILVRHHLHEDPLSGHLFVFVNRRKAQMKILYFESSGYCIWSKRLEQGQFNFRPGQDDKAQLDWAQSFTSDTTRYVFSCWSHSKELFTIFEIK
ncbi:MAG: IS66 family insertion sequence element accessory protein TnpB [Gammaproteobacteria bacterium]|nr:IS66 family insertion sequence element accessory protein TnpB [Gammaproteobacteria bacterium]